MRVHGATEFRGGCFQSAGQASFSDKVCSTMANDMATKNLTIFLVYHQLHEPFFVTCRDCFPQSAEGKFSSLYFISARLCLLLAQANNGDLGLTVNTGRNTQMIDRFLSLAYHKLHRGNPFLGS